MNEPLDTLVSNPLTSLMKKIALLENDDLADKQPIAVKVAVLTESAIDKRNPIDGDNVQYHFKIFTKFGNKVLDLRKNFLSNIDFSPIKPRWQYFITNRGVLYTIV